MVHGGPIHAIPTAVKYGRGVWAQIKRKGAVRSALLQGALQVALRHGASLNQANEFVNAIKESMHRAGSRPKSISGQALSVFRGGPATLFEGPEARHWKGRVRDLGIEALRAYHADAPGEAVWSPDLAETAFAEDYLEEVMAWLNQRKDEKTNPPELAILAEQARADIELENERWWTPTRARVSKVLVAAVIGAGIGHVANVEAPMTVPDWAETGTVAAATAAIAARGSRSGASEKAEIEAAIAEVLTYSQRKLHAALRSVVDQLVQVIHPASGHRPWDGDKSSPTQSRQRWKCLTRGWKHTRQSS
jgi:hypothetical protein